MRILLIEPYLPLARALQRGLEEEGFTVEVAADRAAGGRRAQTASPDLVLLDAGMPGAGGVELVAEWRRGGLTFPVVLLTEPGSGPDPECLRDLGACVTLAKPFPLQDLLLHLHGFARPARGPQLCRCSSDRTNRP